METMRECCALAMMQARKREQRMALARDREHVALRRHEGVQTAMVEGLEESAGRVAAALAALERAMYKWKAERAGLLEVERNLKEELGVEEMEMQMLQEKMSLSLMWASP